VVVAFETERCVVRSWELGEAARFFDVYRRWEVARWLGARPRAMEDLDEAEARIVRWAELNHDDPVGGRWAVQRRDDGVVVGTVLLVEVPGGDGELEVGWHLHPDAWGHGYATEAAGGALSRAFGAGHEEVVAVVRPGNTASSAVCARLGMAARGRTRRYYDTDLELFTARPD